MRRRHAFLRFFPPPDFLSLPAAGVNISDRSIRFAKLKHGPGGQVLDAFGEQSIPPGIVSAGQIQKLDELTKILSAFREKNGLSLVRASLPEQEGYSLRVKIPRVEQREIHHSLELQLEEYVPVSPRDSVFDYALVECPSYRMGDAGRAASAAEAGEPAVSEKARDTLEVGLYVMPRKVVQSYVDLFYGAGLVPLSFELEAHAMARAVVPSGDCGTFMLLDIGAMRTGISVFSRGVIQFTSTVNIGGYAITQSIADELRISFEEARELKEKHGLWGDGASFTISRSRFPALRDEIGKHLAYIRTRNDIADSEDIEKILICGGDANLPGLTEYLSETLKTDMELANPWANINTLRDYVPEIPYNDSLRYAPVLGLALRTMD